MVSPALAHLRRHRVVVGTVAVAAVTIAVDHARPGDDWSRYDHRTVAVVAVPAGDTLQLGDGTRVRFIGVADPVPAAAPWLAAHPVVTLLLPAAGSRDADGCLRAYAFDGEACLNVELVHAGLAYAERRSADVMGGLIDPAEADARRKGRGLWAGLRVDQQPPWRRAWLAGRRHPPTP